MSGSLFRDTAAMSITWSCHTRSQDKLNKGRGWPCEIIFPEGHAKLVIIKHVLIHITLLWRPKKYANKGDDDIKMFSFIYTGTKCPMLFSCNPLMTKCKSKSMVETNRRENRLQFPKKCTF